MKAVVIREFGPVGSAQVEDIETPQPGPGEVRVEVALAPANFVDTLVMRGAYQFLPERPFVPGKGPVGTVSALGADVADLRIGDRVLAMVEQGGYAEVVCAAADQCYALPDAMGFEQATTISLAYDTAWMALTDRAGLKEGETVLVLGATGAVGLAAIQLAKARGARVIAGVASPEKAALVQDAGADATVDIARDDLRNTLRAQVHDLTGKAGVDVVIDPLGGDFFDAALRALAWRGRLVVVGFAAGRIPTLRANYLLLKNIAVTGVQISDYRKRRPDLMRQCFAEVFDLFVAGAIRITPVQVYALEDYARALSDLVDRRATGRVALRP
ncbi:NADPH:quinone oxidoreductase family protein [Roseovarius nitratireducens]|uniref:NADPH:quinone oxidoreductase family protein n=1 Tax=Roseovarius nitratireducens TaxID=2044597 RepID=UPI000CE1DFA2|nr:NADPH:quinone oxidoreductase family protein [Roseovarius nitratireducens]